MKKSTIKARFASDVERVWNVVTDNVNYGWRSDLSKIDVVDEGCFIEYDSRGVQTKFTVTEKVFCKRYGFNIENKNMTGKWEGIFSKLECGSEIEFTERIQVNNPIMNLFVGAYLKKQQRTYIADLKKTLGK